MVAKKKRQNICSPRLGCKVPAGPRDGLPTDASPSQCNSKAVRGRRGSGGSHAGAEELTVSEEEV